MPVADCRIVHIIAGLDDGGAEAALYRLCKASPQIEHHVVSLMGPGKYGSLLDAAGVPVTCLGMPRGRVTLIGIRRLRRTLRNVRPDAVQTWMYHADMLGGIMARLMGIRNICWGIHNSVLVRGENTTTTIWIARLCARMSSFVPRTIVCCAEKSAEIHAQLGYDASIMRVIPNGYDLQQFRPDHVAGAALRSELGLGDNQVVGFVARFDSQKDHDNLLRALAVLRARGQRPDCLLVGDGMDEANVALTSKIRELDLRGQVHLLGRRTDIPAIMNAIDIHILSSAAEAFPNVLAEAMACGTPCVSTDVGDAAAIVGDMGWIVPARDPNRLGGAISDALHARGGPGWAARCAAARDHIQRNYSVARMVRDYQSLWLEKAEGAAPAAVSAR